MKMTLGDIRGAANGLEALSRVKMNDKAAYRVARCIRKLTPELKDIEAKRRELAIKFGATETKSVPEDKVAEFGKQFDALLSLDIEIDAQPIEASMLHTVNADGSKSPINIEPFILVSLGDLYIPENDKPQTPAVKKGKPSIE